MTDTKDTPTNPVADPAPAREDALTPEFSACYPAILAALPEATTHRAWLGGVPMLTAHTTLDGKEYVLALLPTDNPS